MPGLASAVRVGDPLSHESMTVFPLFLDLDASVDYIPSEEALESGDLLVEEVDEGGSVPELLVKNKGHTRVLFLEGEELVGAKQNRVLDTSILIPAESEIKIPVSCVEQGRWAYKSRRFSSAPHSSPSSLRHILKTSVNASLSAGRGHRSDQGEVWGHVHDQLKKLNVTSPSHAIADSFKVYEKKLDEFKEHIPYVDGASGLAVAIGDRVVAFDVVDKPATCRKVWDRLLSGFAMDALTSDSNRGRAQAADVETLLAQVNALDWAKVEPVGEGEEYRSGAERTAGVALCFHDKLVHESVSVEH